VKVLVCQTKASALGFEAARKTAGRPTVSIAVHQYGLHTQPSRPCRQLLKEITKLR
jgi:hypothetical protein